MPEFQYDWMHEPEQWAAHLAKFKDKPRVAALEIGCLEGRSACWLLDNILTDPTSYLTCIDPFQYTGTCPESAKESQHCHETYNMREIRSRFIENVSRPYGDKVVWIEAMSQTYLMLDQSIYDIIIIDGSHAGINPLTDLVLSWWHLSPGGIIIFDDITWNGAPEHGVSGHWPRSALDAFLSCCPFSACRVLYRNTIAILEKLPC